MPGRDGTGPLGAGPISGRGLGFCTDINAIRRGAGFGLGLGLGLACRRGFGRWFGRGFAIADEISPKTQKNCLRGKRLY